MATPTKKQKKQIHDIVSRWAHTLAGTRAPNMERVRELIDGAYKRVKWSKRVMVGRGKNKRAQWKETRLAPPKFVMTHSPMAFRIAQAVIRGYLSKTDAREAAAAFGIDPGFIAELRRDRLLHLGVHNYSYCRDHSSFFKTWEQSIRPYLNDARSAVFDLSLEQAPNNRANAVFKRAQAAIKALNLPAQRCDNKLYNLENNHMIELSRTKPTGGWGQSSAQYLQFGDFFCNNPGSPALKSLSQIPWSTAADRAQHCRMENIELTRTWGSNYFDAELLCSVLGIKNLEHTWMFELAHEVPLCMTFQQTVLFCNDRPVIKQNAAGELHCDDGPAVAWPDGSGQYYLDGHALGNLGQKIVEKPELLTLDDINKETNEEIRRLAIEKYGWGRYLDGIGARVIDRCENWVDNTIEALVHIQRQIPRRAWIPNQNGYGGNWGEQLVQHVERKLILSCRSTARQYFLAVPEDTNTCAAGQAWMAGGANTEVVSAFNRPVRIVGAS